VIHPYTDFKHKTFCDIKYQVGTGRKAHDVNIAPCGFDIETTNHKPSESAYMYIWQFAVYGQAYYGRTWDEFFQFLEDLRNKFSGTIIILIHNMGFEMSFLLPRLHQAGRLKRIFAKAEREPLEVELDNDIIFRDSLALTNMTLQALAKAYCKTQKLVGDLDYDIQRNSRTELTVAELSYCENDVLILSEYAEYLHNEYTANNVKIPLTSTGIVRRMVKDRISDDKRRAINKRVSRLYPSTLDEYEREMQWLFRGAFCHAQTAICNEVLTNVDSHDLKSAYPAEMAHRLYPMTPFRKCNPAKAYDYINMGLAVIMLCEFYNITATGAHVLESSHKILDSVGAEYENGRLYHAEKLTVLITEIDYKIYSMMYQWDNLIILGCKTAAKKPLPDYLIKSLFAVYQQKEEIGKRLKADPDNSDLKQLYMSTKGKLNSFYGMTVARLNLSAWEYDGKWKEIPNSSYEKEKAHSVLSPYWGIYITAYTRLTICTAIVALGDKAYYSDTDSVKHAPDNTYFDLFNQQILDVNQKMCKQYDLNPDIFQKLGMFEFEETYNRFKTLGAKRYITEVGGKMSCTVAGLPKVTFTKFCEQIGNDKAFEAFAPDMQFEISGKNAHKYNDETSAVIDGETMHELGSCFIFSVPFQMRVDTSFLTSISKRKRFST
jgi:DNA polymerase elongation subunit (family B)